MRTSTLLVLSLSTAATLVTAEKEGGGGGALQALLERMQTKKQQNQARALGAGHTATRPPPEDYSNGTDSHNSTSSAPHSNKSHHKTIKDSSSSSSSSSSPKSDSASNKHGKKVHHDRPASSSVESSTKSRLRSSDFARRPIASDKKVKEQKASTILERDLRIAESGGRLTKKDFASVKEVETGGSDQAVATDKSSKKVQEKTGKTFGKKEELKKPEDKRWVWGTAIIQDDTPAASNVPAVGENANYLNSAPANTPTATLAAPSFPPLAAAETSSSQSSAAALQSKVASRQKIGDRKKAAHAPQPASKEKRWTWGSEIIQDGDENAPPVGENANLLSSGTTIAMNTPVAQLTPPSFPPLADATTSAEPATETVEALQSNEGEVEGAQAAAQVVEEASSTLSAVAAQMTSGTPNIEALLNKLQEEINALANAYSQVTQGGDAADAAAETSPAENAKRWVWGPSIIQDDTPASAAPPIGQNTNLLNPAVPVETPSNKPLAPSFPARIGLATAPNNLAAAPASVAPVTPPVSSPAEIESAPESTSTTTSRMNRKSYADSVRSARAAALKTKTAAMEWHLVNKERQVGGMAKQHKRA